MIRKQIRVVSVAVAVVVGLLASFVCMPGASDAVADTTGTAYDINDVGSVTFADLLDIARNNRSVVANNYAYGAGDGDAVDWNSWKHLYATAMLDTHIDDMGALSEGDTVTIPLSQSGRFKWGIPSILPTVRNGVGDIVFDVAASNTAITLTRTASPAVGSADFQLQPVLNGWYGYKADKGFTTTLTAGTSSITFTSPVVEGQGSALRSNMRWVWGNTSTGTDWAEVTTRMQSGDTHNLVARGETVTHLKTPWIFHFHVASADGHAIEVRSGRLAAYSYAAYDATTMGYSYESGITGSVDTIATEGDLSVRGGWKSQTNEDGSIDVWFNAGATWGDDAVRYNEDASSSDEVTNQYLKNTGYLTDVVDGVFTIGFDSATESRSATVTSDVTNNGTTYTLNDGTATCTISNTPTSDSSMSGKSRIEYVGNGATSGAYTYKDDEPNSETTILVNMDGPKFTRDGYTFTGWNTSMDGTGTPYAEGADSTYPAMGLTLTLYAQWTRVTHEVSFDTAGGETMDAQTVADGDTANDVTPTREGYTFDGWYLNGSEYDFATPVTSNLTLKAAWRKTGTSLADATLSKRVTRNSGSYTVTLSVTGSRSDTTRMSMVTITDPLSDWVDPVGLKDGKADGITVTRDGKVMTGGCTAVYSSKSRTVTVTFDDALADKSVYAVMFDVKPNTKATLAYMTSGEYPDTGDKDTGDTSSDVKGYRSNGEATLSWDAVSLADGTPTTVPSVCMFAKPVVQFLDGLPPVLVDLLPGTGVKTAIVPIVAGVGVMAALACAWIIRRRLERQP